MHKIAMITIFCAVASLFVGMLVCAFAALTVKVKKASIWSMPKGRLAIFSLAAAMATLAAQKVRPNLVYRSTFDSAASVESPIVGNAGTCSGGEFVPGKFGKAFHVPVMSTTVKIPFTAGLPAEKGCIEFWARLEGNKDYFRDHGDPCFFDITRASDSAFVGKMEFTTNDGSGHGGLCSRLSGVMLFSGGLYYTGSYGTFFSDYTAWHHYALVWNVDGIESVAGSPVSAILVDGVPVTMIDDGGFNREDFISTLQSSLNINICTSYSGNGQGVSSFCLDEMRVWDSDVTTFDYAELTPNVRYVDASAPEGGLGRSWGDAARTIDEVSCGMNGGVIYVKPGVYGAFSYNAVSPDSQPLSIVAQGNVDETVLDGNGVGHLTCIGGSSTSLSLRLEGFKVRNMDAAASGVEFDKCVIDGFMNGVASDSTFKNCLVFGNGVGESTFLLNSCSLVGCTVVGNNVSGGAVAPNCNAANTIFWRNDSGDYGPLNATNCCVEGQCLGVGNACSDPKFIDFANGDYRLADDSPCIDAGDNSYNEAKTDLAGARRVQNGVIDIGAFETRAPLELVYHSTLDSESAIVSPIIGESGTCSGATFIPGKIGAALHVPALSRVALIPFTDGLPPDRGCIEFWAKVENQSTVFGVAGDPMLLYISGANDTDIFGRLEFNCNNGGGAGGIGLSWPYFVGYTHRHSGFTNYSTILPQDTFGWHHYAIVWNVDGIAGLGDNTRIALLIDGKKIVGGDGGSDWNPDGFIAAMSGPVKFHLSCSVTTWGRSPYAIDELKVWNSDVITYKDFAYAQDVSVVYDGKQHALAAPDGAALQYSLSESGPFVDECPARKDAGNTIVWYVQTVEGLGTVTNHATISITPRPVTFTSASAEKKYDGTPLSAETIYDGGGVVDGDNFAFSFTGMRTAIGESPNSFNWSFAEWTLASNYSVSIVFGTLKVTAGEDQSGMVYEIVRGENGEDTIKVSHFADDVSGDFVLPQTIGGLPVVKVCSGALSGLPVTGVVVPAGVAIEGALFDGCAQVTNVEIDASAVVEGTLSLRGCGSLKEVVIPAGATIAPHSFLGCWELARVVFLGEPPFGGNEVGDSAALLSAAARPASLLQMADMICYPAAHAAKWEKILRNLGYGGRYGAFESEWAGVDSLLADSGNMASSAAPVTPADQPAAQYALRTGVDGGALLSGTVGWDAFNIPDGMVWDKTTGALVGVPVRSGVYDVLLVSGSGASTKIMRTTLEVAGYAVITGYVGVAFSASGLPVSDLKSYSKLPAGLTWKNKVLSGVPTKAGKYPFVTKAGEPVEIRILAVPGGAVGVFNGQVTNAAGRICPVKVTATAAGKVTATVTIGTKAYTLKASRWNAIAQEDFDGVKHRVLTAKLTASKLEMVLKVDADAAWNSDAMTAIGTLGAVKGYAGAAQRDAFSSDGNAKTMAKSLAGTYSLNASSDGAGSWLLVPSAEGKKGALTVKLKATGAATLSGKLTSKTTVSASATVHVDGEGRAELRFYSKGVWIVWRLYD